MAKAKNKSGNYRVLVYSHTENVPQSDGSYKSVRRYASFTHPEKAEADFIAGEFARNKKQTKYASDLTLGRAMQNYIESSEGRLSPTTISFYKKIAKNHFSDIQSRRLKEQENTKSRRTYSI